MKKIKGKLLAAAIALIGFSAASAITGTYAWFVAANTVTVSNMSIKAEAEEGIVMANETHTQDSHWANAIQASHSGKDAQNKDLAYIPTSTADCATWYHANSNNVDVKTAATPYETLTVTAPTEISGTGNGVVASSTPNGNAVGKNVYFLNKFYLQASAKADMESQDVYLTDLTVTEPSPAQDLNKALRIGFKYNTSNVVIFNALGTATTSYDVNTSSHVTLTAKPIEGTVSTHYKLATDVTIPAYETTGTSAVPVSVYMWFEGEDANCKSANIAASMNAISVSFKIKNSASA